MASAVQSSGGSSKLETAQGSGLEAVAASTAHKVVKEGVAGDEVTKGGPKGVARPSFHLWSTRKKRKGERDLGWPEQRVSTAGQRV